MKTILFQGDSITDTFRIRDDINNLGEGYVSLVPALLKEECRIINKGISGETTTDILKRWDSECIDLKPDILCMLMGITVFKVMYHCIIQLTHHLASGLSLEFHT